MSEISTEQIPNPPVKLQQQSSEIFPSQRTQAEIERLRLQHQRTIEAANQVLRKQGLERNQLIQQLNHSDTEIQQ